jgi:hypothetical protein
MKKLFVKLSGNLLGSSVWGYSPATRCVWLTLMELADWDGYVKGYTVPGLARAANVTLAETEEALKIFLSEDRYSRTPAEKGMRIKQVDDGWFLINYAKYNGPCTTDDEKRKLHAIRQQKYRQTRDASRVTLASLSVTNDASPRRSDEQTIDLRLKTKTLPSPDGSGSQHQEFIRLWSELYVHQWGHAYAFCDGKDASAVKRILKATSKTAEELIALAARAWGHAGWNCEKAVTIAGFAGRYNEIMAELNENKHEANRQISEKRVDRNIGNANEGRAHLYAGIGRLPKVV